MSTLLKLDLEKINKIKKNTKIVVVITSLQPLIENSLNCFISSIKIFIRRSLSENPTSTYRPEGCNAILNASSENSR